MIFPPLMIKSISFKDCKEDLRIPVEKITSLPLGDEAENMQEKDVLVNTTKQVSDF